MENILFFKKNKIKKKIFKKNTFLIKNIGLYEIQKLRVNLLIYLYKKYFTEILIKNQKKVQTKYLTRDTLVLNISQKVYNNKGTIMLSKNLHTFSIGTILRYFKVKQGKYVRRSLKGVKIFLNFLKNFLKKNFFLKTNKFKNFILNLNGFDYNLFFLKKSLKNFFPQKNELYLIINLKIGFTKKKDKKIKSIKKRLKKKIIINFIKSNKFKK